VSAAPQSSFGGFGGFGGFDPFGTGGLSASWRGFEFGFGVWSGFGSMGQPIAGATANTSSGLGSPNGATLIPDLVSSNLTTPLSTSGSSGQTGLGTTPTPTPTPTKPIGKHHSKHQHQVKKTTAHPTGTHARRLAKQGHAAVKKPTVGLKKS
jgi:hypothetical protein